MIDTLSDSLLALFLSALISSTLLPGGSEVLLVYQAVNTEHAWPILLLIAGTGNLIGSMITYLMGQWIALRYPLRALNKPAHHRARALLERYGMVALLLAWLPLIGDPLCLLAGWLRLNWRWSLLWIALGKFSRYGFLLWVTLTTVS